MKQNEAISNLFFLLIILANLYAFIDNIDLNIHFQNSFIFLKNETPSRNLKANLRGNADIFLWIVDLHKYYRIVFTAV